MENSKMIRSAKIIDRILKILQGFMTAAVIVCAVFIPLILILGEKMVKVSDSITLGALELQLCDTACLNESAVRTVMIPVLLLTIVVCGIVWYWLRVLRDIFAPLKEGRPFEAGISGQIRKLAWVSLLGGIVYEIGNAVTDGIAFYLYDLDGIFNADMVTGYSYHFSIDGSFIVLTVVLLLLAHVFRYGELLQKESDETL